MAEPCALAIAADRGDETIATLRDGLQVNRLVRIILEDAPDLPDGKIQAMLEVDVGIGAPDLVHQFLARDDFSGPCGKDCQHLGRLRLQLQRNIVASQFAGSTV